MKKNRDMEERERDTKREIEKDKEKERDTFETPESGSVQKYSLFTV